MVRGGGGLPAAQCWKTSAEAAANTPKMPPHPGECQPGAGSGWHHHQVSADAVDHWSGHARTTRYRLGPHNDPWRGGGATRPGSHDATQSGGYRVPCTARAVTVCHKDGSAWETNEVSGGRATWRNPASAPRILTGWGDVRCTCRPPSTSSCTRFRLWTASS